MANLVLSVMGTFAEFERALIRERQCEGIALEQAARRIPWPQEGVGIARTTTRLIAMLVS
jgi:DNA invertase Pin-like site-specific DNA recombinase